MKTLMEIESALVSYAKGMEYDGEEWYFWDHASSGDGERVPGLGLVTNVESVGGEGQGDHKHVVIKVTADDGTERLFRKDGYYSSFEGTEWDGQFREVTARKKTITVYE